MDVAGRGALSKLPQPLDFRWNSILCRRNAPFGWISVEIAIPGEIFGWRDITIGMTVGENPMREYNSSGNTGVPRLTLFVSPLWDRHGPVHPREN